MTSPAVGLLQALEQIPDPRGRQGLRHPLVAMLATVVCAVLCGHRSYAAMAQWIHAQEVSFWHLLGFRRRPPQEDAFRKFLNKLDPQLLSCVLNEWVSQLQADVTPLVDAQAETLDPQTIDGKTLRGTRDKWERARQVVSILENVTGRIQAEVPVPAETNENKAAVELLKSLALHGKIVVADAGFCQRDFCQQVQEQGGEYLVLVKDNQPTLHQEVRQAFVIPKGFSPLPGALGSGSPSDCDHHTKEPWSH